MKKLDTILIKTKIQQHSILTECENECVERCSFIPYRMMRTSFDCLNFISMFFFHTQFSNINIAVFFPFSFFIFFFFFSYKKKKKIFYKSFIVCFYIVKNKSNILQLI